MAELVAEGAGQLEGTEVRLRDISAADHTDLDWCDGIALGSPTNYGSVSWQITEPLRPARPRLTVKWKPAVGWDCDSRNGPPR